MFGVQADSSSFNFVQMSYSEVEFDGLEEDLEGLEFKMNYKLSEHFYLNYENIDVDGGELDMKLRNIGLGFHSKLSNGYTYFGQIDWANLESNNGIVEQNSNEDGYRLSIGIRNQSFENIEYKAVYEFLDIDDEPTNIFVFEVAYNFAEQFSIFATHKSDTDGDFEQYSLGIRYEM